LRAGTVAGPGPGPGHREGAAALRRCRHPGRGPLRPGRRAVGSIRIVGAGRAGGSFALALGGVGWVPEVMLRGVPLEAAADGVDVVLLCVPDGAVAEVAASIRPNPSCVVVHCAG